MTHFLAHANELPRLTGKSYALIARALRGLRAAFRTAHGAIVTAKTRRLQREMMFHSRSRDDEPSRSNEEAAKFPLIPLILGDKWDF